MVKKYTIADNIRMQEERIKKMKTQVRKNCRNAEALHQKVGYSLRTLIEAHVPTQRIRNVYRKGAG